MATAAWMPVEEYLTCGEFEPDAEYVDGAIEERPMGEYDHATWQYKLEKWFDQHAREWDIRVRCELRVQVSPTRFRVPDVVVFDRSRPVEQILTQPPIAVFEVLSPEDRMERTLRKLGDYAAMGVADIFLISPKTQEIFRLQGGGLVPCEPVRKLVQSLAVIDWQAVQELED